MAKALIPLADGFEDIEAITVIDVLRRGGVKVVTSALNDSLDVRSAHGVSVRADMTLEAAAGDEYEAIVLPGGGEGTQNLKRSELLVRLLRRQREAHRLLCAICAAPTVLVASGVLEAGVHVTCYPSCQMELDRPWAPVPVVADRGVITGQAPGSALLFALVVLQHLVGETTASRVAREMVTDVLR